MGRVVHLSYAYYTYCRIISGKKVKETEDKNKVTCEHCLQLLRRKEMDEQEKEKEVKKGLKLIVVGLRVAMELDEDYKCLDENERIAKAVDFIFKGGTKLEEI